MIPTNDILVRLGDVLNDDEHVRWPQQELLRWMQDAIAAIAVRRPSSIAQTETLTLAEGVIQDLGISGVMDVVRVMPNGRPLSRASRFHIDAADPDWYEKAPTRRLINFCVDERSEGIFYVYPPAVAGTQVEALVWRVPKTTPTVGGQLDMPRNYLNAIINYVAFRALSKDSEYADGRMAASYFQIFENELGIRAQSDERNGLSRGEL